MQNALKATHQDSALPSEHLRSWPSVATDCNSLQQASLSFALLHIKQSSSPSAEKNTRRPMRNAADPDWPSLPPIRTSSYNARVSCETLNPHIPPPCAYTSSSTISPPSASRAMDFEPKPVLKCSDGFSPTATPPSTSHLFSSCFPHISNKAHGHDSGKRGTFDAGGLLRSMFGPIVPRYSTAFASGVSPPPNRVSPSQIPNSPSGRMGSPMHAMRSGTSTPHHSGLLRASKGHAMHAFTMMPPDVVGKKKPPGYESDEPTSPEVTCIGKVKKKHYKSTWDALVKDKKKDGKKKKTKGNVKRLSGEISPMSGEKIRRPADFEVRENAEPSFTAKLSRQRSERRRKLELEGISAEIDLHVSKHEDMHATSAAVSDELCSKLTIENLNERNEEPPRAECECIKEPNIATLGEKQNDVPPPDCLLLMKRGSMNRSAHYAPDTGSVIEKEQTRSSESGA